MAGAKKENKKKTSRPQRKHALKYKPMKNKPLDGTNHSASSGKSSKMSVRLIAQSVLPTRAGPFDLWAFEDSKGQPHLALTRGSLIGAKNIPVRLHSQCLTGDALGSQRCDCREQLETAMAFLGQQKQGVLLYMSQEGRGIGLANKIRAYALQDMGADTVEANRALGLPDDARDYGTAAGMLRALGVKSISLMTNNPDKISDLQRHGIIVEGRISISMPANEHDRRYLKTKKEKMNHMIK
jgi:GTP cyclohydrolase II